MRRIATLGVALGFAFALAETASAADRPAR